MNEVMNYQGLVDFEEMLVQVMVQIKRHLARNEGATSFNFKVQASGRVDGELKIEFNLADDNYGTDKVTGNRIQPVIEEYLRRKGWDKTNAPLMISNA